MPAVPATYMLATVSPVMGTQGQLQLTPVGNFGDLEAVMQHIETHKPPYYVVYQNLPVLAKTPAKTAVDLAALKRQALNGQDG